MLRLVLIDVAAVATTRAGRYCCLAKWCCTAAVAAARYIWLPLQVQVGSVALVAVAVLQAAVAAAAANPTLDGCWYQCTRSWAVAHRRASPNKYVAAPLLCSCGDASSGAFIFRLLLKITVG